MFVECKALMVGRDERIDEARTVTLLSWMMDCSRSREITHHRLTTARAPKGQARNLLLHSMLAHPNPSDLRIAKRTMGSSGGTKRHHCQNPTQNITIK